MQPEAELRENNKVDDNPFAPAENTGENDQNGPTLQLQDEIDTKISHWWVYIAQNFADTVFSVQFVQTHNATDEGELLTTSELGLRWLVIALYRSNDLETVFRKLLCHHEFLKLYDPKASLLLHRKNQILESLLCLKKKDVRFKCDILDKFVASLR